MFDCPMAATSVEARGPDRGAPPDLARRGIIAAVAALGAATSLSACGSKADADEDVSATEDLMREHGVLRRILVIYRECAAMLRAGNSFDATALGAAADLFRAFGEDYHERKLEEAHIFPRVRSADGAMAPLIDTLVAQHARGREINQFLLERCRSGTIAGGSGNAVAGALESFARMYEEHAAVEDTIVFQRWRKLLSERQRDEAAETFESIERSQFHGDGFDRSVTLVAGIERRLGLSDLARYTASSLVA
jgi:hemerythrin-like domain-containing protein